MPIIDNNATPMPPPEDGRSARRFVNKEAGAVNVTIGELVMQDGSALRLHTHPTDIAMMVTAGAIQVMIGDHVETVRAGCTLLAPPGVPHKLINQLWIPARMWVTYPASELETTYLE